jgi:uncharacterized membrane protein YphA (DoxX/SURF4 family)
MSMLRTRKRPYLLMLAVAAVVLRTDPAGAHVKWFSDFDFGDPPRSLEQVFTPTFLVLSALAVGVFIVLVIIDGRLGTIGWYERANVWLSAHEHHSVLVMRVAMAAVLLISWENHALLTPELPEGWAWLGWLQFGLALLLLAPRTAPIAGGGIGVLWLLAVWQYGAFHMLDYLHYVGIGAYLYLSGQKKATTRDLGLPVLYATVGFALIWLGFEKLVYPGWGLHILAENPKLLLGLEAEFFLQGSAFVEISLGFLLLIGLLERPLAAVITIVFFTTTLVFGRLEVVGHTPLHAALVVFLLSGPGKTYRPPIYLHKKLGWRAAFAGVNFVGVLALTAVVYTATASAQFDDAVADREGAVGELESDR